MNPFVAVQPEPFDLNREMARVSLPGVGGIGCFTGIVRGDGGLLALTLEHYPGMTERSIRSIAEQAIERFELLGCTIIHRIGRLLPGEPIVLVLAAASHRAAALEATTFLIDWLKTGAPLWKCEEFYDGGRHWVGQGRCP